MSGALRTAEIRGETRRLRRFQAQADRIARKIINTRSPARELQQEIDSLEQESIRCFPGKLSLFRLIYGSRFRRLWEQFRPGEAPLPGVLLPDGVGEDI